MAYATVGVFQMANRLFLFQTQEKDGTFEQVHEQLVEKLRKQQNRDEQHTVAISDSQLVKITLVAGEAMGFDAGKKVKGRKKYTIVNIFGVVLAVVIHSALI